MSFDHTNLLLEAGNLLNNAKSENEITEILVKYVSSALQPDLICFYQNQKSTKNYKLTTKRGFQEVPDILQNKSELSIFLSESKELVCLNSRKNSPFKELLLTNSMNSGLAIAIIINNQELGVMIVNSFRPLFFKKKDLVFLENLASIINNIDFNMLFNATLGV